MFREKEDGGMVTQREKEDGRSRRAKAREEATVEGRVGLEMG